jgi:hypothetical protein
MPTLGLFIAEANIVTGGLPSMVVVHSKAQ